MPYSAYIIHIKNHNEDHEVGGLDLPIVVTLATAPQHTAAAAEMLEAGLGGFSPIEAFNVRIILPGTIQFSTFCHIALGQHFTWNHSVQIERIIIEAQARIENVIERSRLLALREVKAGRCHNGDTAVLDRKGTAIQFATGVGFPFPNAAGAELA